MELVESILTQNPCYQAGRKIAVKGLMLHSVGCPQPNAETFVKKWNNPESSRACVHAFIDGNTGKVYQTLPWDHRAWHSGSGKKGSANNTHIGVELCEPACIKYTGGASFTCSDREAAMAVVKRTYDAAVELFAFLCKQYGLNPLADGVIISHKEGHDRGIASGHGDPDHLWRGIQCDYSMDAFRQAVAAAMGTAQQPAGQGAAEQSAPPRPVQHEGAVGHAAENSTAASGIQTGVMVSLAPDAVYYTGKGMPDWVKNDRWIVKSISGDRAVLGKNESGTHEINSPVNTGYLKVVSGGTGQAVPAAQPRQTQEKAKAGGTIQPQAVSPAPQSTSSSGMTVSDRGVELIAKYEGCRLEAYKCPAGVWTIGYGHTAGVQPGQTLPSKEAAKALLKEDLKKYGGHVNQCVKKGQITFPLTQNQFDALTSFCYNCGAGNLQKLVNGRTAPEVAEKMMAYTKGGGKVLPGLVRRREEEKALFLSQEG